MMKKISIDKVKGGEILAKDIIISGDLVLMAKGTKLKRIYAEKLKELQILTIFVEEALEEKGIVSIDLKPEKTEEEEIKELCQQTIKETMEKFSYLGNVELSQVKNVAEEIIVDILDEPEVLYSVSGIRNQSEGIYSHSLNVCALSVLLALKMKLAKSKIREIAVGSLLHDIGYSYIGLPVEYIKNIKNGKLSQKDIIELRKHVAFGYEAVKRENWLSNNAKEIILHHHERIDGSGYPFHLKGERIKIGSLIVGLCDEFDCRVYGIMAPVMKVHEAIEYISSQAEQKFDIKTVQAFLGSVAAYPNGTKVITGDGEIGVVIRQNPKCPTRPVLQMISNSDGRRYQEKVEKDMTKELTLFIKDTC